jgi:hypothetical protein
MVQLPQEGNRVIRSFGFGAAFALLVAAPGVAAAGTAMGLSGDSPIICSAGIDPAGEGAAGAGVLALGRLREFCNAPEGYELWIDYPPELASDTLVVGDDRIPLTSEGSVRVSTAAGPAIKLRNMSLEGAAPSGNLSLSVRMLPARGSAVASAH